MRPNDQYWPAESKGCAASAAGSGGGVLYACGKQDPGESVATSGRPSAVILPAHGDTPNDGNASTLLSSPYPSEPGLSIYGLVPQNTIVGIACDLAISRFHLTTAGYGPVGMRERAASTLKEPGGAGSCREGRADPVPLA